MSEGIIKTHIGNLKVETEGFFITLIRPTLLEEEFDEETFFFLKKELNLYLEGRLISFKSQFKLNGSSFQMKVLSIVSTIAYGETMTYKDIAIKLGIKSYQAIGQALKNNPLPFLIPCHRVIYQDNRQGYFLGKKDGLKERLLDLEINHLPLV